MNLHNDLLSAKETSKILGISVIRVGVLCRQGRFNGAEKIGSSWIIPRQAVENFTRLPPGVKSKTATRLQDKELIANTFAKLQNQEGENNNDQQ